MDKLHVSPETSSGMFRLRHFSHEHRIAALTVFAAAFLVGGCQKPLPELGTPVEQLYATRCGSCHRPFNPTTMTSAMWQMQLVVMQGKMAAAGQPPLAPEQQRALLDYLQRNAGKQ
jgi:hypothetical protein